MLSQFKLLVRTLLLILFVLNLRAAEKVRLEPANDRIRVSIDGHPVTEYVFGDGASRA